MVRHPQSRSCSLLEAGANVLVGYFLALATQAALYPALGIATSFATDSLIAAAFTLISLVRSYVLRRVFERLAA